MNIAVLYGGLSSEREVSEVSGKMIANALRSSGHKVATVELYFGFHTPFTLEKEDVPTLKNSPPDLCELIKRKGSPALIDDRVIDLCRTADVVFLALHGGAGEDGRLQAFLDCHGIAYTGASFISSAIAYDKALCKTVLSARGIPVPDGAVLHEGEDFSDISIPFPCVIKPVRGGSSVGISFAENESELQMSLSLAFRHCGSVLVEKKLVGRELTVGVIGKTALPPLEIIPKNGFYDYENKYEAGRTLEICPAPISESEDTLLRSAALEAARALGIDSYCRVDFILSDGVPYCLEVNTLPGMTKTSLLPQEAEAAGINFESLCGNIVDIALWKNQDRKNFVTKKS